MKNNKNIKNNLYYFQFLRKKYIFKLKMKYLLFLYSFKKYFNL